MDSEARFRNKITWFSFLFSILVVWVHSANGELFLGRSPYVDRVTGFQRFLGNTVGQIAVPGFFLMSGGINSFTIRRVYPDGKGLLLWIKARGKYILSLI